MQKKDCDSYGQHGDFCSIRDVNLDQCPADCEYYRKPAHWGECPYKSLEINEQAKAHCIEQNRLPFECEKSQDCARAKHLIESNKILTRR